MESARPPGDRVRVIRYAAALVTLAATLIVAGFTTPAFVTYDNFLAIVRAASITGIVAVGMSFVTISGNFFALSAGQMAAFLGILFAVATVAGLGVPAAILLTIATAILAGILQGMVINVIGNPIITTIAFGAVFGGLAAFMSGNTLIRVHDDAALAALRFGTARPLGIPTQSWAFFALALLSWFAIRTTRVGRLITLSGASPAAAAASGLPVGLSSVIAMVIFSCGPAIVAIFSVAQFSLAKADQFSGLDIDAIASVLVGGVALRGGQGSPVQAALGALLIAVLQNFMLLRGLTAGERMTIVGLVVVIAVAGFHLAQGRRR